MSTPPHVFIRSRPFTSDTYGNEIGPEGMLDWTFVDERMNEARNYWIGTTRPDGRPHAMPVWGVWRDEVLYFGTDRDTVKGRNMLANPAAVVHLESGDDVVIIEGVAEEWPDKEEWKRIADRYHEKYDVKLDELPPKSTSFRVIPKTILAWQEKDFPRSATRWTRPG